MDTPNAPPTPVLPLPPTTTTTTATLTPSVQPIGIVPVDEATYFPQNIVGSYCTSGVAVNLQRTKHFQRSPSSSSSSVQYLHIGSSSKKKSFQGPIPTVAKTKMKKNVVPVPEGNEMAITSPPPPPCTECGKIFRTMKSLFGHMRSHPERSWRGIKPPANCQRPRAPVINFTENEYEVASALMLLGRTPPRFGIDRAQGRRTRTSRRRENKRTNTSTGIQVPALAIDLNQPAGKCNDDNDTSLDLKLSL